MSFWKTARSFLPYVYCAVPAYAVFTAIVIERRAAGVSPYQAIGAAWPAYLLTTVGLIVVAFRAAKRQPRPREEDQ